MLLGWKAREVTPSVIDSVAVADVYKIDIKFLCTEWIAFELSFNVYFLH